MNIDDKDDLYQLASRFRQAIEVIPQSEFRKVGSGISSFALRPFPAGCCGDTSELLAEFFRDNGFTGAIYASGTRGGDGGEIFSHAWLVVGDWVVDITADQFANRGYDLPKVYVGPSTAWYQSFTVAASSNQPLSHDLHGVYQLVVQHLTD